MASIFGSSLPGDIGVLNASVVSLIADYNKQKDASLKASYKAVILAKLAALETAFETYLQSLQSKVSQ